MARKVFYSFHYDNDNWRVQQIRNIETIEGNKTVIHNEWEEIKRKGEKSIQNWIDDNLRDKSCLIVLIGSKTANRKWVQYEIEKAWNDGKGVLGIYIHKLKDKDGFTCNKGQNPFNEQLSNIVKAYDPPALVAHSPYKYIKKNIAKWIEEAIKIRKNI